MRDRRARPREDDGDSGTIWLTIYSDMMTNLMLFFLMLFTMSRLQTGLREDIQEALKDQFSGKKIGQKVEQKRDDAQKMEELKKIALVEETESRIKITLPAPVLFEIGKADVKAETGQILSNIAKPLKDSKYPIIVEGHTDNIPISGGKYKSNWHLSSARAFAVLNYFIEKEGVGPARMSALGYGEHQPVASNDTEDDRAKNRRIDIILVKK
ncbi:MAG: OmpA family protein [Endomicrobiia bacterium]|nr:OmpA family protein [Endomicrobiia bacterium]